MQVCHTVRSFSVNGIVVDSSFTYVSLSAEVWTLNLMLYIDLLSYIVGHKENMVCQKLNFRSLIYDTYQYSIVYYACNLQYKQYENKFWNHSIHMYLWGRKFLQLIQPILSGYRTGW